MNSTTIQSKKQQDENSQELKHSELFTMLPAAAKQRLLVVSLGWILVAAVEATAYTVLGFAIVQHWSAYWVLLSALVAIAVTIVVTRSGYLTGVRLAGDLFSSLGQSLSKAKLSWFGHEQRAVIGQMAGQGIPRFMSIPAHQLQSYLHAPSLPIFILIGIGVLAGVKIMLVAFLLIALSFVAQIFAQSALILSDADRAQAELATSTSTIELIEHLELLRTATGPLQAVQRIEQRWESQEQIFAHINRSAAWANYVAVLASVFPMAGFAVFWLWQHEAHAELLFALILLLGRASSPLADLATAGLGINDLLQSFRRFHVVTHAPELFSTANPQQATNFDLSLHNLSYAPVLKHVHVDIPLNARINIAGPSGCGKSTLLELIMRFDDPDQGEITLGGVPLQHMYYPDLVANMAYVSQDSIIFTGTLAENVRLGKANASDHELEEILRAVALGDLIDRSVEGIHQSVGQQGNALSGGERQRVAIARALLKAAPILLLDEATSALDEVTELVVIQHILNTSQTIIFVTHRDPSVWQPTMTLDLTL